MNSYYLFVEQKNLRHSDEGSKSLSKFLTRGEKRSLVKNKLSLLSVELVDNYTPES